jgi:hypothetical protein
MKTRSLFAISRHLLSIRHAQGLFSTQKRSALTSAFAPATDADLPAGHVNMPRRAVVGWNTIRAVYAARSHLISARNPHGEFVKRFAVSSSK